MLIILVIILIKMFEFISSGIVRIIDGDLHIDLD